MSFRVVAGSLVSGLPKRVHFSVFWSLSLLVVFLVGCSRQQPSTGSLDLSGGKTPPDMDSLINKLQQGDISRRGECVQPLDKHKDTLRGDALKFLENAHPLHDRARVLYVAYLLRDIAPDPVVRWALKRLKQVTTAEKPYLLALPYMGCLMIVGTKAAIPIAREFQNRSNPHQYRMRLLQCLHGMGPECEPATEILVGILAEDTEWGDTQVELLVRIGHSSVPFLRKLLKQSKSDWYTIQVLRSLGPEAVAAIPELILKLKHKNPAVRQMAIETLAAIAPADQRVLDAMKVGLRDDYHLARAKAAKALGKAGPKAKPLIPSLVYVIKEDESRIAREAAVEALEKIATDPEREIPQSDRVRAVGWGFDVFAIDRMYPKSYEAKKMFEQGYQKYRRSRNDWEKRAWAIWWLGQLGDSHPQLEPLLVGSLRHPYRDTRVNALQGLRGRKHLSRKTIEAISRLVDPDYEKTLNIPQPRPAISPPNFGNNRFQFPVGNPRFTRTEESLLALEILTELGPQATPFVPSIFRHRNTPKLQLAIANAIRRLAPDSPQAKEVTTFLIDQTRSGEPKQIAKRISPTPEESLQQYFVDPVKKERRLQAIRMLGQGGPNGSKVTRALIDLLTSVDSDVRRTAVRSLANMGANGKEAFPALRRLLGNAHRGVLPEDVLLHVFTLETIHAGGVRVQAARTLGILPGIGEPEKQALRHLAVHGNSLERKAATHALRGK